MEEECDYREAMEQLIRDRKKLCPIKLEFSRLMDTAVIHSLCNYLNLTEEQVFYSEAPLNLSVLSVVRGYAPPQQVPVPISGGFRRSRHGGTYPNA